MSKGCISRKISRKICKAPQAQATVTWLRPLGKDKVLRFDLCLHQPVVVVSVAKFAVTSPTSRPQCVLRLSMRSTMLSSCRQDCSTSFFFFSCYAVTVVGLFEEEKERTGVTSDVVKVKGEDLATPRPLQRNDPGP